MFFIICESAYVVSLIFRLKELDTPLIAVTNCDTVVLTKGFLFGKTVKLAAEVVPLASNLPTQIPVNSVPLQLPFVFFLPKQNAGWV